MVLENPWQQSPSLRYEELWYKEGRLIVCELYQTGWVVVDGRIWDNAVNPPFILKQINLFWNFYIGCYLNIISTASFAQSKQIFVRISVCKLINFTLQPILYYSNEIPTPEFKLNSISFW